MSEEKNTFKLKQDDIVIGETNGSIGMQTEKNDNSKLHSISDSYTEILKAQNAAVQKSKKKSKTLKRLRSCILGIIFIAVIIGAVFFVKNRTNNKDSDAVDYSKLSTSKLLVSSDWIVDYSEYRTENLSITFMFNDSTNVTRFNGRITDYGTYELTDDDVIIMYFNDETLSYIIDRKSDGSMVWSHSYNGYDEILYPESTPKTTP